MLIHTSIDTENYGIYHYFTFTTCNLNSHSREAFKWIPAFFVFHRLIFWALFVLGFKAKTFKFGKRRLVSPALHRTIHPSAGNFAWNNKTQKNVLPAENLGPCKKTIFGLTKKMKLWKNWKSSKKCVWPSSTKVKYFEHFLKISNFLVKIWTRFS